MEATVAKPQARSLLVATRLPPRPKEHTGDPFTTLGDIIVDCDSTDPATGKLCGWHAMGPRAEMKLAVKEHHKMYHPDQTGVILLNQPRQ